MNLIFWALSSHGLGISGGDRIYIELLRRWKTTNNIILVSWSEGIDMIKRQAVNISGLETYILRVPKLPFILSYIYRIIVGIIRSLTLKLSRDKKLFVYASSEFWMDIFPCLILKIRSRQVYLVSTWFQTAPSPLSGYSNGRYKRTALLYWLSQVLVRPMVFGLSDLILVNNEKEKEKLKKIVDSKKLFVLLGAVSYVPKLANVYKKNAKRAVFQGRFHAQKGVVELMSIWSIVVKKIPDAKLVMIGDGPLMNSVKAEISKFNLESNVTLKGFMFDGQEKNRVFRESDLMIHPSFYDSGGMAAAEGMAFGIPCVAFDLPDYESYYPKGLVKVPLGNIEKFAEEICKLLSDKEQRSKLGKLGRDYIKRHYTWDIRAAEIYNHLNT